MGIDRWEILGAIAEERIKAAYEDGQFANLPGFGKPLALEDDAMVPEESRMAFKILKNAGMVPPEIEQEKEIRDLAELLSHCPDLEEKHAQMKKLQFLVAKLNMGRRTPVSLEKDETYYRKLVERTRVRSKPGPEGGD